MELWEVTNEEIKRREHFNDTEAFNLACTLIEKAFQTKAEALSLAGLIRKKIPTKLSNLKQLKWLDISGSAEIESLVSIVYPCHIDSQQLNSLLKELTQLELLDISQQNINELPQLSDSNHLHTFKCHNNQLTSLAGMENLANLQNLSCYNNQLTSLAGVEKLSNLQQIDCSGNELTSLAGVEELFNLQQIDCSGNELTSLEGVEKLPNLQRIECQHNQLTSLAGVEKLFNQAIECYREPYYNNPKRSVCSEGILSGD